MSLYSPQHDAPACVPDAVAGPVHSDDDGFTEAAVAGRLQEMGYGMMQAREIEVGGASHQIAVRKSFYPELGFVYWCWTVFVHRVPRLTAETVRATQARDRAEAAPFQKEMSSMPRGCQRGDLVATIFIADTVEEDARALLATANNPWRSRTLGLLSFCAARDISDDSVHYFRDCQWWGYAMVAKQRHLIGRLLLPDVTPEKEPRGSVVVLVYLVVVFVGVFFLSYHLTRSLVHNNEK